MHFIKDTVIPIVIFSLIYKLYKKIKGRNDNNASA